MKLIEKQFKMSRGRSRSTSPKKISAEQLLHSSEIKFEPLNYERYGDLEAEVSTEHIIEFIKKRAILYKSNLIENVCLFPYLAFTAANGLI